jgi:hypothetical protein
MSSQPPVAPSSKSTKNVSKRNQGVRDTQKQYEDYVQAILQVTEITPEEPLQTTADRLLKALLEGWQKIDR